jgi:MerR family mercuric resistance operon transcriptional regulator
MTIGKLADAAGLNVETIRYYQRRGLIAVPARPPNGQRRYAHAVLNHLAFIRRAQLLGFSLDEIGALMRLDESRCSDGRVFAKVKLEEVRQRITELRRMGDELERLMKRCDARSRGEPCPVIRKLNGEPD